MTNAANAMAALMGNLTKWSEEQTKIDGEKAREQQVAQDAFDAQAQEFVRKYMPQPTPPPPPAPPPQPVGAQSQTVMGLPIEEYYANKRDHDRCWEDRKRANAEWGRPVVVQGPNHGYTHTSGPIYQPVPESLWNDPNNPHFRIN